jgi:hypothetical protein
MRLEAVRPAASSGKGPRISMLYFAASAAKPGAAQQRDRNFKQFHKASA